MSNIREDVPQLDPIIGLEKLRRDHLDNLSKTSFYGCNGRPGFVHLLDVIEIGERRRGVRLSNFNAVLAQRTRPAKASDIETRPAA
jgi:hypothetical protein